VSLWLHFYIELTLNYNDFTERKMVQDSVAYRLQVIGEASRNLSDEIRNKYQQILWRQIIEG